MQVELRPFKEGDWEGLAGAEAFEDGSNPLYGEIPNVFGWPEDLRDMGNGVMVVVDATGIGLVGMNGSMSYEWDDASTIPEGNKDAANVAAMAFETVTDASYFAFKEAGFKPMNFLMDEYK